MATDTYNELASFHQFLGVKLTERETWTSPRKRRSRCGGAIIQLPNSRTMRPRR